MINHIANIGKTQSTAGVSTVSQEAALAKGQERLSAMSDGQTIQGKVMSVTEQPGGVRMAQVDLGDGAMVNARLSGNMALAAGQDISFAVKNPSSGSVTLRPLYANTAADTSVMKALSQAGLPANTELTAMVREMMSEGMPIDRSSLLSMTKGVMSYPGHATSIVQMTNLGITVTPENIDQFENYKNFEHQVSREIGAIMDELPDAFRAISEGGNNKGALDLYGQLLDLFSGAEETATEGPQGADGGKGQAVSAAQMSDTAQAPDPAGTAQAADPAGAGVTVDGKTARIQNAVTGDPNTITAGTTTEQAAKETAAEPDKAISAAEKALREAGARQSVGEENALSADQAGRSAQKGDVLDAAIKALQDATGETPVAQNLKTPTFTTLLRELGVPENILQNVQNANEGNAQTELLRSLAENFQKTAHKDPEKDKLWTKLFSSKEMGGILKEAVARDWLLKPGDVEDRENVRNLYDRLQRQTGKLSQILSGSNASGTHLAENVRNLQNNLNFMNDLNHMFQYVQLPLKMNGQNTHGDLYVYSNKKKSMQDDGTVSAILHLDMEHLGPVDVYVKMKDNNVKTNFYLADDEMIDLIMDHIDILNDRLTKRGYSMEAKMHLQDEEMEEDVPVSEMLKGNLGKMNLLSHSSFDALA